MVLQTFARFSCAGQQVWNGGSRLIMLACHAYTLRFYVMLCTLCLYIDVVASLPVPHSFQPPHLHTSICVCP